MNTNNEAPPPASEGATKNHSAESIPQTSEDRKAYLLNEALKGLRRDFSYTPTRGKAAVRPKWNMEPPSSVDSLFQWTQQGYNLALRTGQASGGIVVIDEDRYAGGKCPEKLPDTVTAITGRDGRHYYFRMPEGITIKSSTGKLAPHVDVKSDGGYIIYPGSVHPETKVVYRWASGRSPDEIEIAELPQWVIDRLTAKKAAPVPLPTSPPLPSIDNPARYRNHFLGTLEKMAESIACAPIGKRDVTLRDEVYGVAGYIHYGGGTEDEIAAAAFTAAERNGFDSSFTAKKARETIRGRIEWGKENPRPIPDRPPSSPPTIPALWTWTTPIPADADDAKVDATAAPLLTLADGVYRLVADWESTVLARRKFVFGSACPLWAVTLLSAAGGTGKSFFALIIAMSIACGRELVPGWKPKGPGKALLVSFEDEALEIHRRAQRIAYVFGLTRQEAALIAQNLVIVPWSRPDFFRVDRERNIIQGPDLTALAKMLAEDDYLLCVLDPVAALLGGAIEENSNESAQRVVGMLTAILPPTTALLLAAHTSKTDRETASSPRGAGAWSDAARQAWGLRPPNKDEIKDLPPGTDVRQAVVLHSTKSNYSARASDMFLVRSQDPKGAGVLQPLDVSHVRSQRMQAFGQRLEAAILAVVPQHGIGLTPLCGHDPDGKANERGKKVRSLIAGEVSDGGDGDKVTIEKIRNAVRCLIAEGRLTTQKIDGCMVLTLPILGGEMS